MTKLCIQKYKNKLFKPNGQLSVAFSLRSMIYSCAQVKTSLFLWLLPRLVLEEQNTFSRGESFTWWDLLRCWKVYNAMLFLNMNQPIDYTYKSLNSIANNKINIISIFVGKKLVKYSKKIKSHGWRIKWSIAFCNL